MNNISKIVTTLVMSICIIMSTYERDIKNLKLSSMINLPDLNTIIPGGKEMTQKYKVQVSMNQAHLVESGLVWKQGDFGFSLEIEVLDFDTSGVTPQIVFRKSAGAVESTSVTQVDNKFTYTFAGTELDTPGPGICDLKLKNSTTQRISTASFKFFVIPDTEDGLNEQASSYSDTIAQIISGYEDSLESLADEQHIIMLDSVTVSGTQMVSLDIDPIPAGTYHFSVDEVTSSDTGLSISSVFFLNGNTLVKAEGVSRNVSVDKEVTLTNTVNKLQFYASDNWSHSEGDTFEFTNFKIYRDTVLNERITDTESAALINNQSISVSQYSQGIWTGSLSSDYKLPYLTYGGTRISVSEPFWIKNPKVRVQINASSGYYYIFFMIKNGTVTNSGWKSAADATYDLDCDYFCMTVKKVVGGSDQTITPSDADSISLVVDIIKGGRVDMPSYTLLNNMAFLSRGMIENSAVSSFSYIQGIFTTSLNSITNLLESNNSPSRISTILYVSNPKVRISINSSGSSNGYHYLITKVKNGVVTQSSWDTSTYTKEYDLDCDYFGISVRHLVNGVDQAISPSEQNIGLVVEIVEGNKYNTPTEYFMNRVAYSSMSIVENKSMPIKYIQGAWTANVDDIYGFPIINDAPTRISVRNIFGITATPQVRIRINSSSGYNYVIFYVKNGVITNSGWKSNADAIYNMDCDYFCISVKKVVGGTDQLISPAEAASIGLSVDVIKGLKFDTPIDIAYLISDEAKKTSQKFINPYKFVDWDTDTKVSMTTHDHCPDQTSLDNLVDVGMDAVAVSNYHPSSPAYPLADCGLYTDIPDVIEIPNAEHVGFTNITGNCHLNSLGSTFSSGNSEITSGAGTTWQRGIHNMLSKMLYSDVGGITINHPVWSGYTQDQVEAILDLDDRVLGIEIFNQSCEDGWHNGWALQLWDNILITGRRCWGFAVPDHAHQSSTTWYGKIVLMVGEPTQYECLKALNEGAFYIQYAHTDLELTDISISNRTISVTANKTATIKAIIDKNVYAEETNTTLSISVPEGSTYCRFEIATENDTIYTNPFMFRTKIR